MIILAKKKHADFVFCVRQNTTLPFFHIQKTDVVVNKKQQYTIQFKTMNTQIAYR